MNILIVDDEESIRDIMLDILTDLDNKVFTAENGEIALKILNSEKIDLCFLDVWMPNMGGIEVLEEIREKFQNIEVVMISGHAKIDHAVKVTKMGAYDFLEKPLTIEKIVNVVKSVEVIIEAKKKGGLKFYKLENDNMIGSSVKLLEIKKIIETSSKSDARIMIYGENGSGKELIAREIHNGSLRANKPFVSINCAAIPENLIESELFGYVKGAFTGAYCDKQGKLELANGGTFFLDEVADMGLQLQVKLLRVLQEQKITRLGDNKEISIDVRFITATNKDIKEEIKKGNFREDLYYRLNVIPINVPPLRERKDDIPELISYFNQKLSVSNNLTPKRFTNEAIKYLSEYNWPGNIRQLRNIIERLLVMVDQDEVSVEEVNKYIDKDWTNNDPVYEIFSKYKDYDLNEAREEFERMFIISKLKENNYNLSQTARRLGIFPSNLSAKLAKLGIDVKDIKN